MLVLFELFCEKELMSMAKYVVVGGGIAGVTCVETVYLFILPFYLQYNNITPKVKRPDTKSLHLHS